MVSMVEHRSLKQFVDTHAGILPAPEKVGVEGVSPVCAMPRGVFRPLSAAVLFLGSFIIFSPLIEGGTTHLPNLVMRTALFAMVLVWIFRQMKSGSIAFDRHRLFLVLALFFSWAALTLGWAPYKNASVQWLVTLLMYVGLFGVVTGANLTGRQVHAVVMIMVATGLCEGLLGLAQYFWLGEERARGTFFNPNFFATYEVMIFAIASGLAMFSRWTELRQWERMLIGITMGVTSVAFLVTQSRGAVPAIIVAMVFVGYARFGKLSLIVLVLCLLAGALFPNPLKHRFMELSSSDPYAYSRVDIWKSSLERIVDRPLGVGIGMYKYTSFQYRFPIDRDIVRYQKRAETAHNEYLQLTVELGLAGLAIFLVGLTVWAREARDALHSDLESRDRGLVVGLVGAVMAMLMHGMVDSVFHEPALMVLLIICGGLVVVMGSAQTPNCMRPRWSVPLAYRPVRAIGVFVIGFVLAILVVQPAVGWYLDEQGDREAQVGHYEKALEWFERASLVDPGTTAYRDSIARTAIQLFHRSGDPQWLVTAMEHESVAHTLNPLDGRFPFRLGTIYTLLSEQKVLGSQREAMWEQAAHAYEEAIRVDPYSPLSYAELGRIRVSQGRVQEAKDWFQRAIAVEPNFLPARVLLANLWLQVGDRGSAQSEFETIRTIMKRYERRTLSALERQFLDVNIFPLGRALATGGIS
jgi:putative inorganic carbon (HCO3(-)) transporter